MIVSGPAQLNSLVKNDDGTWTVCYTHRGNPHTDTLMMENEIEVSTVGYTDEISSIQLFLVPKDKYDD